MTIPKSKKLIFIESNTSGTGYEFIRSAGKRFSPILITSGKVNYKFDCENLERIITDTNDLDSVFRVCEIIAHSSDVAGVMSTSDYYVYTAAAVANHLGLRGPNPDAVLKCRNKAAQRKAMMECGLAYPCYQIITSNKPLLECEIPFPVVVKPVSGSGSVGVKLCEDLDELNEAISDRFRNMKNERGIQMPSQVLVEEYIDGDEYSAEVFGDKIIGITEKHLGPHPNFVEIGHDFPAVVPDVVYQRIQYTVLRLCNALGLTFGAQHVEFRIKGQQVYVIEVNPRLAGGHIPTLMGYALSGRNIIKQLIDLYTGSIDEVVGGAITRHVSLRFIVPKKEGTLLSVNTILHEDEDGYLESRMYRKIGDYIHLYGDFRDRIGHIIYERDSPFAQYAENPLDVIDINIE